MFLVALFKRIQRRFRLARLAQLQRDFTFIVERTRRERKTETVHAIAERLQQSLDDVQHRITTRPADRATVAYDLTQSNRNARNRNDQVAFTALTLSIIHWRALQLDREIDTDSEPHARATSPDSVQTQAVRFIERPDGDDAA